MIFLFICICNFLFAGHLELFIYWNPDIKGQEGFTEDSLQGQVRKKLLQIGWDVSSWEPELYRPAMLGWKGVRSWQELKWRLGFDLPERKRSDLWVFWNLGLSVRDFDFGRGEKEKMVLFLFEPPVVQKEGYDPKVWDQFGKIFTWDDDLVDGKKFFKFFYPVLMERIEPVIPFGEKKFCTMVASRLSSKHPQELYSEREKIIRFFEDKVGEFDLYGRYWGKRKFKNYRGEVVDKIGVMRNYKFAICYENTRDIKGYITEKIFHCFGAGCVPVYWGASNVEEYIPEGCFVDRRQFENDKALYDYLRKMGEREYARYLERAGEFLKSEKARLFTVEHFVETFCQTVQKPSS